MVDVYEDVSVVDGHDDDEMMGGVMIIRRAFLRVLRTNGGSCAVQEGLRVSQMCDGRWRSATIAHESPAESHTSLNSAQRWRQSFGLN